MNERIYHPFQPIFDEKSKILILGTIPSPKSREVQFYYGHPHNRFWRILQDLFETPSILSVEDKKRFLLQHKIALWDVLASCEINGADDSSIRNAVPNNLNLILQKCSIRAVFTNGQKASLYYRKYFYNDITIPWFPLPSTSPANCRNWTYETLKDAYRIILDYF